VEGNAENAGNAGIAEKERELLMAYL